MGDRLLVVAGDREYHAPVRPVHERQEPASQPFLDSGLLLAGELAEIRVARNHDPIVGGPGRLPGRQRSDLLDALDIPSLIELRQRGIEPGELHELAYAPCQYEAVVRVEAGLVGMARADHVRGRERVGRERERGRDEPLIEAERRPAARRRRARARRCPGYEAGGWWQTPVHDEIQCLTLNG